MHAWYQLLEGPQRFIMSQLLRVNFGVPQLSGHITIKYKAFCIFFLHLYIDLYACLNGDEVITLVHGIMVFQPPPPPQNKKNACLDGIMEKYYNVTFLHG